MLDMDIDAFFREQDERMNEPEDDIYEFNARMTALRCPLGPYHASFGMRDHKTLADAIPEMSQNEAASDDSPEGPSAMGQAESSEVTSAPSNNAKQDTVFADEAQTAAVLPIFTRLAPRIRSPSPSRPVPRVSIDRAESILKRKEAPTKPDKPSRKKSAIDTSAKPSLSILSTSETKPVSKKRVSPSKIARPIIEIPPPQIPSSIDLSSSSPIEEPNFSVLVSRFEPTATSTQLPKLAAEPSAFQQMLERTEKHARLKQEKKLRKASSKTGTNPDAGPSKAGPTTAVWEDESEIISISSSSRPVSPEPKRKAPAPTTKPKPPLKAKAAAKSVSAQCPKPALAATKAKGVKGKKGDQVKMVPKDYAQMLNDRLDDPEAPKFKWRPAHHVIGQNIFYVGGELSWASETTMGRMKLIIEYGGNLMPEFDPERVTHIVTHAGVVVTLRTLALKSLSDVPDYIPIVRWSWVDKGGPLFEHAAFSSRIPPIEMPSHAGSGKEKGKGKQHTAPALSKGNVSHISAFTQDKKRRWSEDDSQEYDSDVERVKPGSGPGRLPSSSSPRKKANAGEVSSSRVKIEMTTGNGVKSEAPADPLAEFYARARAERDEGLGEDDKTDLDDMTSDSDDEPPTGAPAKRGWTCDNKDANPKDGPNELIAKKLEELGLLHKAKPTEEDKWRAFNYQKAARAIRKYPKRIKKLGQARSIRGVGDKTAQKIMEIVKTGDLQRIQYENTEDVKVGKIFQGIYGVGQNTSTKWYAAGCRTLKDLLAGKGGVVLTPQQKIGIEFYEDINDRMPREEVKALFDLIKPIALHIDPKLEVHVMGSYRRGKADCGDIDIMITRDPSDGRTHAGILHHLLKALHARGIVTEDLALPEDPFDLEAIYRGLCRLPDRPGSRRRRIDFLTVPWKNRGAALLYYTGDDIFNRAMRMKANVLGFSLNQKGLFAGVVRDPRNRTIKLNTGNVVASETEEEIFRMLDVPFQEPHERVRG